MTGTQEGRQGTSRVDGRPQPEEKAKGGHWESEAWLAADSEAGETAEDMATLQNYGGDGPSPEGSDRRLAPETEAEKAAGEVMNPKTARVARWARWQAAVGVGQLVTWVVIRYSSRVLARLSAWLVRWERPELHEAGRVPPDREAVTGQHWRGHWGDRVSLGKGGGLPPSAGPTTQVPGKDVPHLREDGISLADETFTLVELPLQGKAHLSVLCPGPLFPATLASGHTPGDCSTALCPQWPC